MAEIIEGHHLSKAVDTAMVSDERPVKVSSKRVNLSKVFCKNLKNCTILLGNFKERERTKASLLVPKIECFGVTGET